MTTKGGPRTKLPSYSSDMRGPQHLIALAGISGHINLMMLNSLTSLSISIFQGIFSPNVLHILIPFTQHTAVCSVSQVELNECVQCEFTFINTGKFNFSFQAELSGPKALVQYFEFSPTEGSVDVGQSTSASLSFQPLKKCVLKGLELRIKVRPLNTVQH